MSADDKPAASPLPSRRHTGRADDVTRPKMLKTFSISAVCLFSLGFLLAAKMVVLG